MSDAVRVIAEALCDLESSHMRCAGSTNSLYTSQVETVFRHMKNAEDVISYLRENGFRVVSDVQ